MLTRLLRGATYYGKLQPKGEHGRILADRADARSLVSEENPQGSIQPTLPCRTVNLPEQHLGSRASDDPTRMARERTCAVTARYDHLVMDSEFDAPRWNTWTIVQPVQFEGEAHPKPRRVRLCSPALRVSDPVQVTDAGRTAKGRIMRVAHSTLHVRREQ
jgi:hypothetical protein